MFFFRIYVGNGIRTRADTKSQGPQPYAFISEEDENCPFDRTLASPHQAFRKSLCKRNFKKVSSKIIRNLVYKFI
tara:strand:+ start:60 stop:284 length:225 start_codon:yes stop_codon:yes gene_type:complete